MFCKRCNSKIDEGQKFCDRCGMRVEPPVENKVFDQPRKKKRTAFVFVSLVIICLVAGVCAFTVDGFVREAELPSRDGAGATMATFDDDVITVEDESEARAVAVNLAGRMGFSGFENQIGECRQDVFSGETYYRFSQQLNGVPVYGSSIIINVDSSGKCSSLTCDLASLDDVATEPTLDVSAVKSTICMAKPDALFLSSPYLAILPEDDGTAQLVYVVEVSSADAIERCFVSAHTGEIVLAEQLAITENVGTMYTADYGITAYDAKRKEIEVTPLEGSDEKGNHYTFNVERDGSIYYVDSDGNQLEDNNAGAYCQLKRGDEIVAERAFISRISYSVDGEELKPVDINLQKMSDDDDKTLALIDNAITSYKFFEDKLGYVSFNGAGGNMGLISNVALPELGNHNAYSLVTRPNCTSLVFGYDNPAKLETVGHEYTHSVEASICNMQYSGESGALKEATSDIFGELIEDYHDNGTMDGSCDWMTRSRNMVAPDSANNSGRRDGTKGYPATYKQAGLWGDTNENAYDNGHVHNNSTVISHAAYLMCKGDLDGDALTTEELAKIHFASFHMLTKKCSFSLYAGVVEHKARDLLTEGKARRVAAAFEKVGITAVMVVDLGRGDASEDSRGSKGSEGSEGSKDSSIAEDNLRHAVENQAKHEILHWFYTDFDTDGDNEAFAITGIQSDEYDNEWTEGEIWYADENGVKRVAGREAGNALNGLVEDAHSGYKFLSLEEDGHGSNSISIVYAVKDGVCIPALFDIDYIGCFHEDDGRLVGYTSNWDTGFHEYDWYEFSYDPVGVAFKSTGVIEDLFRTVDAK